MTVSPYFKNFSYGPTQNLIENLVIEAIKHRGYDIFYLPREQESNDDLLNESPSSIFKNAIQIEVYIKNIDQFGGSGDYLSKFGGYTIDDTITFTVSKKRFLQALSPKLMDERGYNVAPEDASPTSYNNIFGLVLEGDNYDYISSIIRPREGDLIYFPMANKIFEIEFIEHESVFYQFGKNYVFDMQCSLLDYSNEVFETGDLTIDRIYKKFDSNQTLDDIGESILLDSPLVGEYLTTEDGDYIDIETSDDRDEPNIDIEVIDKQADNMEIEKEAEQLTDKERWLYGEND